MCLYTSCASLNYLTYTRIIILYHSLAIHIFDIFQVYFILFYYFSLISQIESQEFLDQYTYIKKTKTWNIILKTNDVIISSSLCQGKILMYYVKLEIEELRMKVLKYCDFDPDRVF